MGKSGIVVVDFDGTIVRGQSQVSLVSYLFNKGQIGFTALLKVVLWNIKYKYFSQKIDKILAERMYSLLLRDRSKSEVELLVSDFVDSVLMDRIQSKVIDIIESYKKEGYTVLIVSSSLDVILNSFNRSALLADKVLATVLDSNDKSYSGKIRGGLNEGAYRVASVKREIANTDPKEIIVISDNLSDLELLEIADRAIVINPRATFASIAKDRNFEIMRT